MSGEQRGRILAAMDAEDADVMRRLLSYEEATAGGMMTPEVVVLGPTATVAEALAQIREPDWVVSIAAQVFVCHPPFKPPTGRLLGTAPPLESWLWVAGSLAIGATLTAWVYGRCRNRLAYWY